VVPPIVAASPMASHRRSRRAHVSVARQNTLVADLMPEAAEGYKSRPVNTMTLASV
jgi:hypothetical protein